LQAIAARDKQDRENPVSPTIPAQDAIIVNTDGLSIEEVFSHLRQLVTGYPNGK
jgi:cytidylate kinase